MQDHGYKQVGVDGVSNAMKAPNDDDLDNDTSKDDACLPKVTQNKGRHQEEDQGDGITSSIDLVQRLGPLQK